MDKEKEFKESTINLKNIESVYQIEQNNQIMLSNSIKASADTINSILRK